MLIFAEGDDAAGDLGADIDYLFGLHRAGGADGGQQVAPLHRDGAEARDARRCCQISQQQQGGKHRQGNDHVAFIIDNIHLF